MESLIQDKHASNSAQNRRSFDRIPSKATIRISCDDLQSNKPGSFQCRDISSGGFSVHLISSEETFHVGQRIRASILNYPDGYDSIGSGTVVWINASSDNKNGWAGFMLDRKIDQNLVNATSQGDIS